jgi:hypothetical protein
VSTSKDQNLAEFLLGDPNVAADAVIAAHEAASIDKTKYPATRAKRGSVRRPTVHYGTGDQLIQKHVLRFADIVSWVHEARCLEVSNCPAFYTAREEGVSHPSIMRAAFERDAVPANKTLLLRRYVAALLTSGGWPDTEWLAVAVSSVLRSYPVNELRISGITEHILGGNPASGYTTEMRNRIKNHLGVRFSHLPDQSVDLGHDGMGVEHTIDEHDYGIVREALSEMSPWGVPCLVNESAQSSEDETFADTFQRWMHKNRVPTVLPGKGGWKSWYFRERGYPDDEGRTVMFRAHALICVSCFQGIAADLEQNEIDGRNQKPFMTRQDALKLRFPDFRLPMIAITESA